MRWLRAHAKDYNLDPDHIGAYGNSAGGHLALLLGMVGKDARVSKETARTRINRAWCRRSSATAGRSIWLHQYQHDRLRQVISQFLGGPPEGDRAAVYKKASPINHISPKTPPLLLLYGGADEQVPVETADQFVVALGRAGLKDVSYYRLAYVDHCPHSLVRLPELAGGRQ